ncbi:MAG: type II toxin-antitoxin system VapC family toxin [Holophagales bacterium]|nr:type II toxin-antitoxin system VapC family toxin [Holophagales bacterium]MYH27014.1 type II toxin-antitoxin system VapC family toxin [Holophagales bacterium]
MRYLLDANVCIALLNGTSPAARERLGRYGPGDVGVPAPVAYELYFGAFKSRRTRENLALLDTLGFEVLPFDVEDARAAGKVRSDLEAVGQPIGPYDVLIAGQALARGLVLVTANRREFDRVTGLTCEDWTRPDQN